MVLSCTTTLAVALAFPPQDLLSVKGSRKPLRGTVTVQTNERVVFNPYFSTHPQMTWGIREFPAAKVKQVRPDVPPREQFWVRLDEHKGSADQLVELAGFCKKHRLKQERLIALEWALRSNPEHIAALAAYSTHKAKAFLRKDPIANKQLRAELDAFLSMEDADARHAKARAIIKKYDLFWSEAYFARAWRSHRQPKGLTNERPLTLRGNIVKGVYTLYVPEDYDPFTPTPLVVGLHGGGRGGKDGKKVVGNGRSAMSLYRYTAGPRGYIIVCPTAISAPWSAGPNDPWIRAMLDEVEVLFNIDKHRVYLTGHSMGGFGSWYFGPKYCDRWAAIGPTAGSGANGLKKLRDTKTFCYVYHGGNDSVVPPGGSRAAAKRMLDSGNDFIYTELPDSGHGLPRSVLTEMFRFFGRKRLAVKNRVQARPRSTFLQKESKDEIRFFGRLLPKRSGSAGPSTKSLLKTLAEGGGAGERAAAELAKQQDPKLMAPLLKILKRKQTPADGRALAAQVLGHLGDPKALPALASTTLEPKPMLPLVHEAVAAIARIEDPRRSDMILKALANLCTFFEGHIVGSRMNYSDWNVIVPEMTFALQILSKHQLVPADIGTRLDETVVKRVLLRQLTIRASRRAGQDTSRARDPLLQITRKLLRGSDDDLARTALAALEKRYGAERSR
ncbi:MAG: hypothetical protein ACYTF5_10470 [Planctomycetota bacterium]|jgi:pimeloyl-ACP methyl ester carboxylesterase